MRGTWRVRWASGCVCRAPGAVERSRPSSQLSAHLQHNSAIVPSSSDTELFCSFVILLETAPFTGANIGDVTVDGKDIEVVTKFVFLGALITKDGLCEKEVRRRIAMGKAAMGGLTSIWKDRGVTMETKVKLAKVLVFPIVLYGAETWTMGKHERRKIDAFELWCWRRVLRVSWMERKTNIWIIENIKPEWTRVKGAKGCIKLLWARGESRRDRR